jgi:beta-lactamase regulating signal transducer with metallopeptidase domain
MLDVKFSFFSSMKLLYYYQITSLIWNIGFIISWTSFIGVRKQLFYLMKHNRILYYQFVKYCTISHPTSWCYNQYHVMLRHAGVFQNDIGNTFTV